MQIKTSLYVFNFIKTTMKYPFMTIRMTIIEKTQDNIYWQGCELGDPCTQVVRMSIGRATMEDIMDVSHKLKY